MTINITQKEPGVFIGYTRTIDGLLLTSAGLNGGDGFVPGEELPVVYSR